MTHADPGPERDRHPMPGPLGSDRLAPMDLLLAGIWFGLVIGLGEAAHDFVRRHWFHKNTMMGPGLIWMAPLMDVIWLLLPASGLALLALRLRGRAYVRVAWFALTALALILLFITMDWLHTYAAILLALGGAVQLSRGLAARPATFRRLVRRTVGPLVIGIMGVGLAMPLIAGWREHRALTKAPAESRGAPNVLLLILDTVRSLSASVDGHNSPTTPSIARFARTGVHFANAWAPSAWTLSSHASMFTGFYPHEVTAGLRTPLDSAKPTLAEALTGRGYATAGFVANLHYVSREFGLQRGFAHYEDYRFSPGELFLNSGMGRYLSKRRAFRRLVGFYDIFGRKHAASLNHSLLRWLNGVGSRPFFAFVNYYDAHEPYLPTEEWDRKFASPTPRKLFLTDEDIRGARRVEKTSMTPAEVQREREAYEASIAYTDHEIGRLLDSLQARGLLENTLVIITSDHGEQFGEHGLFVHGNSLYLPLLWVPLVMALPSRLPAEVTVPDLVNLRNLPKTIMDVLGLGSDVPFPGSPLSEYWTDQPTITQTPNLFETVSTERGKKLRAIAADGFYYIRTEGSPDQLFDMRNDRHQETDLGTRPEYRDKLSAMSATMDSVLATTGPDVWGP